MKSLSKATFHLLCCILLLGTFQSCKDDETTPPPPGESATLTISDVKAEANTVTFTITPKNVDVYTYTIKSATVTPQATVQDPAETKTFTYNSLLPSSDYTIVATGFTQGGLELTSTEYKFRTLDTQDPGLEVPSGEEPFIEYGDQRIAAKSVFFYKGNRSALVLHLPARRIRQLPGHALWQRRKKRLHIPQLHAEPAK